MTTFAKLQGPAARPMALALLAAGLALFAGTEADAQSRRQQPVAESNKPTFEDKMRQEKTYPTKVTWTLKTYNNKPVGGDYTLMIDDNFRGSGASGCNNWSATIFPVKGQKLAVGPIAITKRKCEADKMAMERNFLVAIHSGPTWDIVGSDLVVKGQNATLVFQRAL